MYCFKYDSNKFEGIKMSSKLEISQFKNRLIDKNVYINYKGISNNKRKLNKVVDAFLKSKDFDAPDGYHYDKNDNILYIFEHFEFDCSKRKKKSSELRENISRINREINNGIKEISYGEKKEFIKIIEQGYGVVSNNIITYKLGSNGDKFRENYIHNFTASFQKHEKNIDTYKVNCLKEVKCEPKQIVIIFIVEDVTIMGTSYNINGKQSNEVNLLFTKQFIELFEKSHVDYVIFKMKDSVECSFSIIEKDYINENIKNKAVDLSKSEFYVFPAVPQITSVKKINI